MKKLLLLLLLSVYSYGQVSTGNETEFDYGIKNNSTQTVTTPVYIGTIGSDGTNGKIDPLNIPVSTATQTAINGIVGDYINDGATAIAPSMNAVSDALSLKIPLSQKGVANGVATLGVDAKIPNSQLPALAITDTYVVTSQSAMLALSMAEQGDVAVRTDLHKSFILTNNTPSTLANWQELLTPTDAVSSVDGQVGNVDLTGTYQPIIGYTPANDANVVHKFTLYDGAGTTVSPIYNNILSYGFSESSDARSGIEASNSYSENASTGLRFFVSNASGTRVNLAKLTDTGLEVAGNVSGANATASNHFVTKFQLDTNDSNVIHKTGDETKTGNLNVVGNLSTNTASPRSVLDIRANGTVAGFIESLDAGFGSLFLQSALGGSYLGTLNSTPLVIYTNSVARLSINENTGVTSFYNNVIVPDGTLSNHAVTLAQLNAITPNATHTGDATGATVLTLATVNSNVGTFGNASNVSQVTVNAKGLTTAISNVPIQIAESQVTNLVSDLSTKQAVGATFFIGTTSIANNRASGSQTLNGVTAAKATVLETPRAINGVYFNGSADITLPDPRPYKVYTARLEQFTTGIPTATVLENTFSGTPTWTRTGVGSYRGTFPDSFSSEKLGVFITPTDIQFSLISFFADGIISIKTYNSSGVAADALLKGDTVEVRAYN